MTESKNVDILLDLLARIALTSARRGFDITVPLSPQDIQVINDAVENWEELNEFQDEVQLYHLPASSTHDVHLAADRARRARVIA